MIDPDHLRLSIVRQCQLVSIARSTHYYTGKGESALNLELMRVIDEQYLLTPWYGSRQLARHLRRQGYAVDRERVRRLMRKMGLTAIYRKPKTSKPDTGHRIYPYLLRKVRVDRPNQAWCADITYIPMHRGFLYLVVIMDWATRTGLSWRLSNTLDSEFCIEALEEALAKYGTQTSRSTDFHGRQGPVDGQRLHRAPVALSQIRVRLPARPPRWAPGLPDHRYVAALLQRGSTSLEPRRRPDADGGVHSARGGLTDLMGPPRNKKPGRGA